MQISDAQKDEARAVAVRDHIARHTADALRLLQPRELVICYHQHPALREVIYLAIDEIACTLRDPKVALDAWRAERAIQEVINARAK